MSAISAVSSSPRGQELFSAQLDEQRVRLDRIFSKLMLVQWFAAIVVAVVYSPQAWAEKQHPVGGYLTLALVGGAVIALLPNIAVRMLPGATLTRHLMAVCQILFSSMFIHLSAGRIDTHFHIFGSLAWLAFYLDWQVLATATLMVVLDHSLRGLVVPESVYGMMHSGHLRFVEHALWVVFEDVILLVACRNGLRTLREGADRQAHLEALSESEANKTAALEMALEEMREAATAA